MGRRIATAREYFNPTLGTPNVGVSRCGAVRGPLDERPVPVDLGVGFVLCFGCRRAGGFKTGRA